MAERAMVAAGQSVSVRIEKPAAGGRMIARVDGQVILVNGAIPGEQVTARIDRVGKGVAYAETISVEEPSDDRRQVESDPLCGGCVYAHIAYPRQLALKAEVIVDGFSRIGHLSVRHPVVVAASAIEGYRMRARLHARNRRLGFFREGSHDICDVRATRQLLPATCDVLDRLGAALTSLGSDAIREVELSENIAASQRVIHLDSVVPVDPRAVGRLAVDGVTGLTLGGPQSSVVEVSGDPRIDDVVSIEGREIRWRRHVLAFFQGNRYLLRDLVAHVVSRIAPDSAVLDLYAGGGLFSVASAMAKHARVTAVEGDRFAAADLADNAKQAGGLIEPVHQAVEDFAPRRGDRFDTLVLDPPRTGMSKGAFEAAARVGSRRIVYVSCDVATLARDARRLVDAGYELRDVAAFDMFPNTPHVEVVGEFEQGSHDPG